MDIMDTEAVWQMLIQPMVVLEGDMREQVYVRALPDEASEIIGEVTCATQGVHVIAQTDDGWALIECYSSSFKGSPSEAWNQLICGYVKSSKLKTYNVKTKYGIIVDKLDQRLYVFCEGQLLDVLAVSTGLSNEEQPYNETRSGEYLLYSRTGAFPSDNMVCNYGIRYNDGDLLHEVPHVVYSNGNTDYSATEEKLGQRASHGCIRVQRKRTPNGINMRWLWNELYDQMGTRMVIWEDWQGRMFPYPDENHFVYYNPNGGQYYHREAQCYAAREKYWPLSAISYAELHTAKFLELTVCPYCFPALRKDEIEQINREHGAI